MTKQKMLPANRETARFIGAPRYIDSGRHCPGCGGFSPVRYVETDECQGCVDAALTASFGTDPIDVYGYANAIERGLTAYFLPHQMCPDGPHLKMFGIRSRAYCLTCQVLKARRNAVDHGPRTPRPPGRPANPMSVEQRTAPAGMSRRDAEAMGFQFRMSEHPCKEGHLAPRLLAGGCLQCLGRWKPAAPASEPPRALGPDDDDPNDLPVSLRPGYVPYAPPPKAPPVVVIVEAEQTEDDVLAEALRARDARLALLDAENEVSSPELDNRK